MSEKCKIDLEFVPEGEYVIPSPDFNADNEFNTEDLDIIKAVFLNMPGANVAGYTIKAGSSFPDFEDEEFLNLVDFQKDYLFNLLDPIWIKKSNLNMGGYFPCTNFQITIESDTFVVVKN